MEVGIEEQGGDRVERGAEAVSGAEAHWLIRASPAGTGRVVTGVVACKRR